MISLLKVKARGEEYRGACPADIYFYRIRQLWFVRSLFKYIKKILLL